MNDRPKIRIPVSEVPWASGTIADLECYRRRRGTKYGEFHPNCCRFPKSCSAFNPGFKTGKGPTTLPIVWNDGHGWRSGQPDWRTVKHLFDGIWRRWAAAVREKIEKGEVSNDDDGCGYCTGTRCAGYCG